MTSQSPIQGVVALSDWGVIRAFGADAASFLHSQLTNDFTGLGLAHARLAGYCSAKGRLLASFVGWRESPDEILLACSADLLAPTLKRLSMFVLRAKCKLSDASAQATGGVRLYGLAGDAARAALGDLAPLETWGRTHHAGTTVIRLPDGASTARYLCAVGGEAFDAASALPAITLDEWRWLEVQSGVPMISAATVERFVPQMLNFEKVGGVNFQKGCYPGQEIVARAQYRGTVKRRTFLFDVAGAALPGMEVYADGENEPAGMVALAAPAPGPVTAPAAGSSALVELKLSVLEGRALHLGAADGPLLQRRPLPYSVEADDESAGNAVVAPA